MKLLLALAVAIAAARLLVTAPPEADQGPAPSPPASIAALESAVRENAISPYRWLELAEGYESDGQDGKARLCFHRAQELGPNLPAVWIRAAGYHFRMGEKLEGLQAGARAQQISDANDAFLFQYYDHFVRDTGMVIRALETDRRSLTAYLQRLMAAAKPDEAELAWAELKRRQFTDSALAFSFIDFLLANRRYETAMGVWLAETPASGRPGYPGANHIYNGGFEREFTGSRLDWKIVPDGAVAIERDSSVVKTGKYSVRLMFPGTGNISLQSPVQTVVVVPGTYRLSAWVKTDAITTDQGLRFCIADAEAPARLNLETDPIRGTNAWTEVGHTLVIPAATHLVSIAACRVPSQKFDNKIAGTAWIDDVSLTAAR